MRDSWGEDGPWADDTISYTHTHRQRTGLSLAQPDGAWTQSCGFDVYGRLTQVTSSAGVLDTAALRNGHCITNRHDALARLTGTTLVTSSGAVRNAHGYQLNLGHQRTNQVFTNTLLSLVGARAGSTCNNETGVSYLRSDTAGGLFEL